MTATSSVPGDTALPAMPADAGLTWRPLTPDDVPAWFALTSAIEDHDDALSRYTETELADLFKGSWRDPARDTMAGFDADGTMRAYARVEFRHVTSGTHAPYIEGAVHPDWRGRGLGTAGLTWGEARARQLLSSVTVDLPSRIRVFADEHVAGALDLFASTGFTPLRWYVDMRRDLSTPLPKVAPPDGVTIEPYDAGRQEDVRTAHNESFAVDHFGSSPYGAEEWQLDVLDNEKARLDWSFVALADGRVIGYTFSGAYDQDWEPQGFTEGWTDLVAVRREWRGRGIAGALLVRAMGCFRDAGLEFAGLDVDTANPSGALGTYTRLGYERRRGSVCYSKELCPRPPDRPLPGSAGGRPA